MGRNEETQRLQIGEQECHSKTLGPGDFSVYYNESYGNGDSYSRTALFSPAPYSTTGYMCLFNV